jgi:hypothetical protein
MVIINKASHEGNLHNIIIRIIQIYSHCVNVMWVPSHRGMACSRVADGGDGLRIWRVAANTLNKQSRTAEKGWTSSLGIGRRTNNSP